MSTLPLQGPGCRLFLPNHRSKILLFEELAVKTRCRNGKDLKIFLSYIVFRMLKVKRLKNNAKIRTN